MDTEVGDIVLITSENAFGEPVHKVLVRKQNAALKSLVAWCTTNFGQPSWVVTAVPTGWCNDASSFYFHRLENAVLFQSFVMLQDAYLKENNHVKI